MQILKVLFVVVVKMEKIKMKKAMKYQKLPYCLQTFLYFEIHPYNKNLAFFIVLR